MPIKEIDAEEARGRKKGNFFKNVESPKTFGYCVAGEARAPPKNDPRIVPVENRNPNMENPLAWLVRSVDSPSTHFATATFPFKSPHVNRAIRAEWYELDSPNLVR